MKLLNKLFTMDKYIILVKFIKNYIKTDQITKYTFDIVIITLAFLKFPDVVMVIDLQYQVPVLVFDLRVHIQMNDVDL